MMKLTAQKVTSLYDLMDSAYDAESIYQVSRSLGHVPIIDNNPGSGLVIHMAPADALRYKTRTAAEHTNGRLKEEFGGRHVMVRGHEKVKLHLMFGIIALFADIIPSHSEQQGEEVRQKRRGREKNMPTLGLGCLPELK